MTVYFTDDQTKKLNDLTRKLEERTGTELVAAVVGKCDNYPEIPWKAFAMAAAAGALVQIVLAVMIPGMPIFRDARLSAAFVLGAGATLALISVFCPFWGRLFLDRMRAESETDQYARALFLEKQLFLTGGRTGILVLIGLFERRVVIVPDSGVSGRLAQKSLHAVIDQMIPYLKKNDLYEALVRGIAALENELVSAGFKPSPKKGNEIPDGIIEQRGAGR